MKIVMNIGWFLLFFILMMLFVEAFGEWIGLITAVLFAITAGVIIPWVTQKKNNEP